MLSSSFKTIRQLAVQTNQAGSRLISSCDCNGTLRAPIETGQFAETERSFSEQDVAQYARLINDPNPLHSETVQGRHPLLRRSLAKEGMVVHGMLVASLFSSIVGTKMPQAVYLSQNITFCRPVCTGQKVVARIEAISVEGGRMVCNTIVRQKETNETVLEGRATVWVPREFR